MFEAGRGGAGRGRWGRGWDGTGQGRAGQGGAAGQGVAGRGRAAARASAAAAAAAARPSGLPCARMRRTHQHIGAVGDEGPGTKRLLPPCLHAGPQALHRFEPLPLCRQQEGRRAARPGVGPGKAASPEARRRRRRPWPALQAVHGVLGVRACAAGQVGQQWLRLAAHGSRAPAPPRSGPRTCVHQRHQRDRHVEHAAQQACDGVELVWALLAVQHPQRPEQAQPLGLVGGAGGALVGPACVPLARRLRGWSGGSLQTCGEFHPRRCACRREGHSPTCDTYLRGSWCSSLGRLGPL